MIVLSIKYLLKMNTQINDEGAEFLAPVCLSWSQNDTN